MSILQPPILSTSVVKTEPPTVIKNEPPKPEIMNIDIDEDIKNIDIVSDPLSEDLIKSETVPENIFESKHSEYVEAQAFVQAENVSLGHIENIIKCEKTEDTDDGNGTWDTGQEGVEVQGIRTKHPKRTDYARCHKTLESNLWKKEKEKIKVIKAPVIQYSCDRCDFETRHCQSLKAHNIIHLKPEESQYFYCDHCSFKSRRKYGLKKHIFRLHNKNVKRFRCDHCDYKTYLRANLKKHNIIHLKPEERQYLYCDHCSFKCMHKSSVQNHIFKRHFKNVEIEQKEKRFSCDRCNFKTCYSATLKTHNLIHLKPEDTQYFYCSHCSFKTKYKYNLSSHQASKRCKNVEIEQKRFRCDHCDYKTRYSGHLKRHNLIHLKPEESQYFYCDHCSFKSRRKNGLKIHIFRLHNKNVESKQKRFSCSHCSFKTKYKKSLSGHQASRNCKNVEIKQKRFRCDHCNYKTQHRGHLKMHNLIHLNPEEVQYFYCSHCSFKSKYKSNLKAHILRHFQNEEVKFCCYICDFMTLGRELIISHIKTHSKVRNKSKINEGN